MIMTTFNRFLGPLSICLFFFTFNLKAQGFEKILSGTGALSLSKEGNFLRVETCEDSSRVDLIVDQEGNLIRREVYFKGTCRSLNVADYARPYRLADGNFIRFIQSSSTTMTMQKLRTDGSLIFSRVLDLPCANIWLGIQSDTAFFITTACANASNTGYRTSLIQFDSLGNRVFTQAIDTAMLFNQYINFYFTKNNIFLEQRGYEGYLSTAIQKFDKNGRLLATIPFRKQAKIVAVNPSASKLLYADLSCSQSCVPNSLNYMDSQIGANVSTVIPAWSQDFLIFRPNQVYTRCSSFLAFEDGQK